jgi:hypothetical protein
MYQWVCNWSWIQIRRIHMFLGLLDLHLDPDQNVTDLQHWELQTNPINTLVLLTRRKSVKCDYWYYLFEFHDKWWKYVSSTL